MKWAQGRAQGKKAFKRGLEESKGENSSDTKKKV
jgi:hypothetical protein